MKNIKKQIESEAENWMNHYMQVQGSVYPLSLEQSFEEGARFVLSQLEESHRRIESEAKKIIKNANKLPPEANYFGSVDHIKIEARTIIELLKKEKLE